MADKLKQICIIKTCNLPKRANNYCEKHYRRYVFIKKYPLYYIRRNIITRCYNQNFRDYHNWGGRGITVCDRWLESYKNFAEDVGKRPSPFHQLDRIDNDGNYEPGNVRWATAQEQQRNRRNNRLITIDGDTKTLAEWCSTSNIKYSTIRARYYILGWPIEKALEKRG